MSTEQEPNNAPEENPTFVALPPTDLVRHTSNMSNSSNLTYGLSNFNIDESFFHSPMEGLFNLAGAAVEAGAVVANRLRNADGNYDPESKLFKEHASKPKSSHTLFYKDGPRLIKESKDLEDSYSDKRGDLMAEVYVARDALDEIYRKARHAKSDLQKCVDAYNENEKDYQNQQAKTACLEVQKDISKAIKDNKCKHMAQATGEEAQAYANLSTNQDWANVDNLPKPMCLLENTSFHLSKHCPVNKLVLYRRKIGTANETAEEFRRACQYALSYNPSTAAAPSPKASATSASASPESEAADGLVQLYAKNSVDKKLSPKKRLKYKRKLEFLLATINEDDDDEEEEEEEEDDTQERPKKRVKTSDPEEIENETAEAKADEGVASFTDDKEEA